jgi:hypothetical protein
MVSALNKPLWFINDCAECAVKVVTDFKLALRLTQDEEQHQFIFQVVEHHRKQKQIPAFGEVL